jgi:hypothetical protein
MNIIAPVTRFSSRNALRIKKNSPQILFYAGIVGSVATTVLASRATLRAVPVVEKLKANRGELDSFHIDGKVEQEVYSDEVVRQYTEAGVELTKLYGPVVLVGVGSLIALTKSHQQLTTRNTALTMAYTGLFKTFDAYRERVREQLGDERDQQFLHGTVQQAIEYEDKGGRTRTKEITALDPSSKTPYTFYFDKNCGSWMPDPGYNQNTLDGQQQWANVKLQRQGHLFLNEVYDLLQIPHTKEGAILGWVHEDLSDRGIANDMFVKFNHDKDGEFTAGYKKDVMLEFNIHGPILDLI